MIRYEATVKEKDTCREQMETNISATQYDAFG